MQDELVIIEVPPKCAGCGVEIEVGMHYLRIPVVEFMSRMPEGYKPEVYVPSTKLEEILVHDPACFNSWAIREPLIREAFDSWYDSQARYAIRIEGRLHWGDHFDAVTSLGSGRSDVLCEGIREADGTERDLTKDERDQLMRCARSI